MYDEIKRHEYSPRNNSDQYDVTPLPVPHPKECNQYQKYFIKNADTNRVILSICICFAESVKCKMSASPKSNHSNVIFT